MEKIQELLAINIKLARQKLGYSQMKLAERSDLSTGFIAEIEVGRKFPSPTSLQKIADALGLKPYQLFIDREEKDKFERYNVISELYKELKDRIDFELGAVIKKYLS